MTKPSATELLLHTTQLMLLHGFGFEVWIDLVAAKGFLGICLQR